SRHCVEHLYVFEDFPSGLILLTGNRFPEIRERLRLIKWLVALSRRRLLVLGLAGLSFNVVARLRADQRNAEHQDCDRRHDAGATYDLILHRMRPWFSEAVLKVGEGLTNNIQAA